MHLYRITTGNIIVHNNKGYINTGDFDALLNHDNLHDHLLQLTKESAVLEPNQLKQLIDKNLLPPVSKQEVWAAGVTYLRSRDARMEESQDSGAGDCYHKVYTADRPELFFKSMPHRVAGPGENVYIRKDSTWNVPEPELTLFINKRGNIQGYTVGNDMSSRSIEGENPLYLPQAKIYERSVALGPCVYVSDSPLDPESTISLLIRRNEKNVFEGKVKLKQMKRELPELARWLYAELDFPHGCFMLTGTGIVPPDDFTLQAGDNIQISIENIGTLSNTVEVSR